ncbi:MAG: O-methyltransferase [Gemmatimonadota bacterium]
MVNEELFAKVDAYVEGLYGGDDADLTAVEASLAEADMPRISVSPVHGRFLHLLALTRGATRILELGTLAGYSTIWMARALPPDGRLITIEADPKHQAVAQRNLERAGVAHLVEIRGGRALDVLQELRDQGAHPFDLIFIDADKPPMADYFRWALQLSRPGTLIIADNVIRSGTVLDANHEEEAVQGVRRFNALLAKTHGITSTILQTVGRKGHDGLALALVR